MKFFAHPPVATVLTVGLLLLIAGAAYIGRVSAPPCPTYEQAKVDSLQLLRGQLRADSIAQAEETARWQWIVDSLEARKHPMQNQVDDAFDHSLVLPVDSLTRGLLATPSPLP